MTQTKQTFYPDGFHEGEWERDVEVHDHAYYSLTSLERHRCTRRMESVKTMTYDELVEKYGELTDPPKPANSITTKEDMGRRGMSGKRGIL